MSQVSSNSEHDSAQGITRITVKGYKSLLEECSVEIRPLTILSGANSSGKSSIMQPLLLMKQTIEATYDPGSLKLDGPNVRFTSSSQLLARSSGKNNTDRFSIKIDLDNDQSLKNTFVSKPKKGINLTEMVVQSNREVATISAGMSQDEIISMLPDLLLDVHQAFTKSLEGSLEKQIESHSSGKEADPQFLNTVSEKLKETIQCRIVQARCFFDFELFIDNKRVAELLPNQVGKVFSGLLEHPYELFSSHIRQLIHVPGLRGNPERTYKTSAVNHEFSGTFENYVASLINHWQRSKDGRIKALESALETLGLTWKVDAEQVDDTQVELRVGRLPHRSNQRAKDTVSIADVGFGVSQTLPVLVALLAAEPGQLVYLEQPEIHLHPRAQVALAQVLADAANRGVRVVVETHSELFLLGVQSLVAEGRLAPHKVKLHWFTRREDGVTQVSSADLDETGAFGDWSEDFGDVSLRLENRYLSAAETHLWKK